MHTFKRGAEVQGSHWCCGKCVNGIKYFSWKKVPLMSSLGEMVHCYHKASQDTQSYK